MLAVLTVTADDVVAAVAGSRGPASLRRALVGFRVPDVVVLDVEEIGAPELTAAVADALPDARLLVVAPGEDDELGLACLRAGADGFLARDESRDGLMTALAAVRATRTEGRAGAFPRAFDSVLQDRPRAPSGLTLTPAQERILDLMTTGATNRAIAARVGRSEKAVKNEATAIYAAMDVANRTEAVATWSRIRDVPA